MNRNQKIALGCGGAGCLGLIVVFVAGLLIYMFAGSTSSPTNRNRSTILNDNSNSNSTRPTNRSNSSNSNSETPSSSMSDDDKHKIFQAATITADVDLVKRVSQKIGIVDENGTPNSAYQQFVGEHAAWALKNYDFITSINTAEKGRAYVDEHIDD